MGEEKRCIRLAVIGKDTARFLEFLKESPQRCEITRYRDTAAWRKEDATGGGTPYDVFFLGAEAFRCAMAQQEKKRALMLQRNGAVSAVELADIRYIESAGHRVVVHTRNDEFEYYARMSDLEQELGEPFFRIHKGYLVNLNFVASYNRTEAVMEGGGVLVISRYRRAAFVKAYRTHIRL